MNPFLFLGLKTSQLYKSYISYKPETQIIDEGPDDGP